MPNALELLTADHRKVEDLFDQFEQTGDEAVAAEICDDLTVHTQIEEDLVYPALQQLDANLEQEAEREHAQAKEIIARIRGASGDDLISLVDELRVAIEHHVAEEESRAFPTLQGLGEDRLTEMAVAINEAKARTTA